MANWYKSGFQVVAEEEAKSAAKYGPRRFWMKEGKGNGKKVVFIDGDAPFCIREHNPKINGSFGDPFTCLADEGNNTPFCCETLGKEYYAYLVGFSTVVNMSEWTDKQGVKHSYELELFAAKTRTLNLMNSKKDKWGQIEGCIVDIERTDAKSPNVGNDFELSKKVSDHERLFAATSYKGHKLSELWEKAEGNAETMAGLRKVFLIEPDKDGKLPRKVPAFNYLEVLKPKAESEIRKLLSGFDRSEKGKPSGTAHADDIPF